VGFNFSYFLDNLAYGKATCESSTYDTRPPSIAVDGVIAVADTTDYWVTHTKKKEKQFWMVDIGDQHNVQWIEFYNRQTHRKHLFLLILFDQQHIKLLCFCSSVIGYSQIRHF